MIPLKAGLKYAKNNMKVSLSKWKETISYGKNNNNKYSSVGSVIKN